MTITAISPDFRDANDGESFTWERGHLARMTRAIGYSGKQQASSHAGKMPALPEPRLAARPATRRRQLDSPMPIG